MLKTHLLHQDLLRNLQEKAKTLQWNMLNHVQSSQKWKLYNVQFFLQKKQVVNYILVHISTSEAIQTILKAQREGVDVTVESCPHYFAMTAEQVDEIGPRAKCQPPIRKAEDQAKLWDELLNGNIDWLTSDHSPCTEDLKQGNSLGSMGRN